MRVLMVEKFIEGPPFEHGGVGRQIRLLSEGLRARGWQVELFGGTDDPARASRSDRAALRDYRRASPVELGRMIHDRTAARRLEAFLGRNPIDLAHLHNIYHHLTPSILGVLARRGIPAVMTLHDYRLACPTKHFLRADGVCTRCLGGRFWHAASGRCAGLRGLGLAIESAVQIYGRRYARGIERFLCPSRFLRDVMRRAGLPAGRLEVVENLVDFSAPPAGAEPAARDSDVLFAGRLSEEKGPQLLLDLAERRRDLRVAVLGDGPLAPALRRRCDREGLANVDLPGAVGPEEIPAWLDRTKLFVLPSRCLEVSPSALLEAMGRGVCVLAADHPSLRGWVREGETGGRFPPGDPRALAARASELLADDARRGRLAEAGRRHVRTLHEPRRILDRVEDVYRKALRCGSR